MVYYPFFFKNQVIYQNFQAVAKQTKFKFNFEPNLNENNHKVFQNFLFKPLLTIKPIPCSFNHHYNLIHINLVALIFKIFF